MAADIGPKIELKGEASYNKAMREAAKNTKALGAELKLAEAQFKATGNAEELMTKKDKILRDQLEQQKTAVQTATDALKELEKKGFAENSTKVIEWRSKLAQAQEQVLELEGAIKANASGAERAGQAYDDLGEAMQNAAMDAETARENIGAIADEAGDAQDILKGLGVKFSWDGLRDTLSGINDQIDAVIGRAVQMGQAIWQAGVDATVWADDLITQSIQYGMSPETLQRWRYASRFVDTSVETIVGAQTRLLKNMSSESEDMAVTFAHNLHVATRDTNGELRSVNDVFWDVIGALGQMDNEATRDALAMDVLGKSAKELNPLIEAGKEAWDAYADNAPVIGKKQLADLGSANDALEDMNAQLEALKLDALAYLAPIIQEVAEATSAAAKSMKEFLDSDEGQAALTSLQEAVSGLITDFTELDFGQILTDASEDITGIISGFADLLKDKDSIIAALKAIGVGIVGMKVAEAAASVATLVSNFKLLSAASTGGAAAKGVSNAAAAARLGTGPALSQLAGPLAATGYMGASWLMDFTEAGRTLRDTGDVGAALEQAKDDVAGFVDDVKDRAHSFLDDWTGVWDTFKMDVLGIGATVAAAEAATSAGLSDRDRSILQGIANGDLSAYAFDDLDLGAITQQLPASMLARMLQQWGTAESWYEGSGVSDIDGKAAKMAQQIIDSFDAGVQDKSGEAGEAVESAVQGAMDAGEAAIGNQPETLGANTAIGFGNGILSQISFAVSAAQSLVDLVVSTIVGGMAIGSPSKVMAELGEYVAQGFALGMDRSQGIVMDSAGAMAGVVLRAPEFQSPRAAGAGGGADVPALILSALSNMTVQIDGHDAGRVILPTLEELMTEQLTSRRWE